MEKQIIASTIASITALLISIGIGDWIKSFIVKPQIRVVNYRFHTQGNNLKVWRILIENLGNNIARDVQAEVTNIYEDGESRKNFLPLPLRWTHGNERKDIFPKQTVYLDILDDIPAGSGKKSKDYHRVRICSRFGSGIDDFLILSQGESNLEVHIFHKKMLPKKLNIFITVDNEKAAITKIKRW